MWDMHLKSLPYSNHGSGAAVSRKMTGAVNKFRREVERNRGDGDYDDSDGHYPLNKMNTEKRSGGYSNAREANAEAQDYHRSKPPRSSSNMKARSGYGEEADYDVPVKANSYASKLRDRPTQLW